MYVYMYIHCMHTNMYTPFAILNSIVFTRNCICHVIPTRSCDYNAHIMWLYTMIMWHFNDIQFSGSCTHTVSLPRKCSDHSSTLEDSNSLCSDPKRQVNAMMILCRIQLHTIELQSGWEESGIHVVYTHVMMSHSVSYLQGYSVTYHVRVINSRVFVYVGVTLNYVYSLPHPPPPGRVSMYIIL